MATSDEGLIQKALSTTQSSLRQSLLRQIYKCSNAAFIEPLLQSSLKESEDHARAELLRVAVLISASQPKDSGELKKCLTHSTAWSGAADTVKIEALVPLINMDAGDKVELPASLRPVIKSYLNAAETKQALKTHSCLAWALTLGHNLETTEVGEAFLNTGTLLAPTAHLSPDRLVAVDHLITTLCQKRPDVFTAGEATLTLSASATDLNHPRFLAVASLLQSIHWRLTQANLESIRYAKSISDACLRPLAEATWQVRGALLSAFITLSSLGLLDGVRNTVMPALPSTSLLSSIGVISNGARRSLLKYLLSEPLPGCDALLCGAFWSVLAQDRRSTRRDGHLRVNHIMRCCHLSPPEPTTELAEFLRQLLSSKYHANSVTYFVRFFSEAWTRKLHGDAYAWSEWFKNLLEKHLLFSLDVSDSSEIFHDRVQQRPSSVTPVTVTGAAKQPKAVAKSAVKPKAKVSAAAARLLKVNTVESKPATPAVLEIVGGAKSGPASSTVTNYEAEPNSAQECALAKLLATNELVSSWPMVCAFRETAMLTTLSQILKQSEKKGGKPLNLAVQQILATMTATYIAADTVPDRQLLPDLLYGLCGPRSRCDITFAERLCAGLNDMKPLSTEASGLVLPVIMALLSHKETESHRRVSFVAVHRAINTILFQLKLGARMNSEALLSIMRGIVQDKPALLSLCEQIVSLLDDSAPLPQLLELLDCENAPFRRAILKKVIHQLSATSNYPPEAQVRLLVAKYDLDEPIRRLVQELDFADSVPLADCIQLLGAHTSGYQKTVARTIANVYAVETAVPALIAAFSTTFKKPEEEIPEHLRGFKLNAADLERIKAKSSARVAAQSRITVGETGCVYALSCVARSGPLRERYAKEILDFVVVEACKLLRTDLASEDMQLEQEFLKAAENTILSVVASSKECAGAIELFLSKLIKERKLSTAGCCLAVHGLGALGTSSSTSEVADLFIDLLLGKGVVNLEVKKTIVKSLPVLLRQKPRLAPLIEKAEALAFESKDLEDKISGALLLAACIRAEGWPAYGGIERLSLIATERKEFWVRHGVYLALEAVVELFGRAIEPQAKEIVVIILSGSGDAKTEIRDACQSASKKFMKALAGSTSLREILPSLLEFTNSASWRTKVGALNMLAHLASSSAGIASDGLLNQILPILIDASHAPHKDVKEASQRTLRNLLTADEDCVLQHPDTRALSAEILAALQDTNDLNLLVFLRALGDMKLSYKLDSASVCIIHLLLLRAIRLSTSSATNTGMRAEIREKTCQLVGVLPYLCANPEQDLGPLIKRDGMLPELFKILGAPTPIVRQTCARTIGLLTEVLGSCLYREILPYLIKTLKQVDNVVERSGCANALVEVLRALGPDVLSQHLPDILKQAGARNPDEEISSTLTSSNSSAREGFLGLFVYFPLIFGDEFRDFVPECLPVLILGLEASEEGVRDIAFRAIKIFVQQYGSTHTPLLLAPIESALFNRSEEVRLRAVGLLGTLVDKILKGAEETTTEGGELMQLEVLSLERRAYVLSAIFIVRGGDEDPEVRHCASNVWKSVVQNTPRTVRELLPLLTKRLMDLLASGDPLKETSAGRCMNEMVSKHGERLLPEIMAAFIKNFEQPASAQTFRGAFLGLQAVIQAAPPLVLRKHIGAILPVIREALSEKEGQISKETRESSKEQVVRAVSLIAASEVLAKEELIIQNKKAGTKKIKGPKPTTTVTADTQSIHTALIQPLLEDATTDDGRLSPEAAEGLLATFKLFMTIDPELVVTDLVQKCRTGPLSVMRLRLLATLCYSNSAVVTAQLRGVCRIVAAALHTLEERAEYETLERLLPEIRVTFDALMAAVNGNDMKDGVVPSVVDMLELHEARMFCTVSCWEDLLDEGLECPEVCSAEQMIALTSLDDREPRAGSDWGRWVTVCMVSSLYKMGMQTDLWMRDTTLTLVPLVLPLALYELHRYTVEEGALWLLNMTKALDKTLLVPVAVQIWRFLQQATSGSSGNVDVCARIQIPGLQQRSGIEALVSVLQPALLYGNAEVKEKTSAAFELLVKHAGVGALQAVAVKVAGQLIRGFAEKASASVKTHILSSLTLLLSRVGAPLRLLVPQLQSSFVRCIGEPELGIAAAQALTLLSTLAGPRVNLLVSELAKSLGAHSANEAPITAIVGVLGNAGTSMTPATLTQLRNALLPLPHSPLVTEALEAVEQLLE